MHRVNYIEKIGTGINRIKEAINKHKNLSVEFQTLDFFTVTFYKNLPKENGGLNELYYCIKQILKYKPNIYHPNLIVLLVL